MKFVLFLFLCIPLVFAEELELPTQTGKIKMEIEGPNSSPLTLILVHHLGRNRQEWDFLMPELLKKTGE